MSDGSTKKTSEHIEPTNDSIKAMPEVTDKRFHRRPGRGHHASKSVGEIIAIDADLWSHFGSEKAVNQALRRLVEES